ncbi:MAG: hypothetical protein K6G90_00330 [Clostridia bacterium]|nr:hypothetical protein [Clostridia bacterium]
MKTRTILPGPAAVLTGALLLGFLWRVRGTHGWGSSWGVLAAGFVFTLFLTAAAARKNRPPMRLIALASLSFMLTAPAWGTLLGQITGILGGSPEGAAPTYISPAQGALFMALMGFGLAGMFGVLLGRCFTDRPWRLRDYIVVLAVFLIVFYGMKATLAHPLVKLLSPQATDAFRQGLAEAGIAKTPFAAYLSYFNAEGWAKKIAGGRHYYACVSAISSAAGAAAAICAARFFAKDRFAAKTGAVVCGAFAFSITAADLFFFFGNGGYRGTQGFSLPQNFAAWSLWEYFTGFIAGGIITFFILRAAPAQAVGEPLISKLPEKPQSVLSFLLVCIGAVGLNAVRPMLVRTDETPYSVWFAVAAGVATLGLCVLMCRKCGFCFRDAGASLPAVLCAAFTLYFAALYFFAGSPEIKNMGMLHNILAAVSAVFCTGTGVWPPLKNRTRSG